MTLQRPARSEVVTPVSPGETAAGSPLARIIAQRAVFPVFQPIVDLTSRKIVAVEALARGPAGSPLEFPEALYRAARQAGLLTELDQLCAVQALAAARAAGPAVPPLVFINAEPAALRAPLPPDVRAAVLDDRNFRVVLEFTERALSADTARLLRFADEVHQLGDALALDDVGTDPLSMAFLPLIEPDVVKLDMHLLRTPYERTTTATAAAGSGFAERTGATVLAEGLETEDDVATALALGARWGQGWLFGHPGPLAALAGRPVNRSTRLRPAQPGVRRPVGTPFGLAATRNPVRSADERVLTSVVDHVVAEAAAGDPHTLVLAASSDAGRLADWSPRLNALRGRVAWVNVLPAGGLRGSGPADHDRPGFVPIQGESALAVISPHRSIAVSVRHTGSAGADPRVDFVLTQDRELVQQIARMIILQSAG